MVMPRALSLSRLNELQKIIASHSLPTYQHFALYPDYQSTSFSTHQNKVYIPSNTGKIFHESKHFVKVVMGPYGSGKSTMCIQEIVRQACNMPAWSNGRRKSKWLIVRNTSG